MNVITCRPIALRWIAFVAFAALLTKAAVPLLAATAAGLQGKAVAEVCAVWGVRTAAAHPTTSAHAGHHEHGGGDASAVPGDDHCALAALIAFGATPDGVAPHVSLRCAPAAATPRAGGALHDADAAWIARQKHEPPAA
jgi:hypothetical protein